ncbi:MAG: hypothetical protein BGO41_13985 [Clostridiales bacterium 38-18]|nr:MAG: hypothetical protein BGO41_13985 [Clostridiales bacterium 38-18]
MRITQNSIVQNSINLQKNPDLQALVGKTLTGRVIGQPENGLVAFVFNGNKVTLNTGQLNLVDQQMLTITINDIQEGVLLASIFKEDGQQASAANAQLLSKLGLPVNSENLQILNQLKLSNLPINSESFQNMRQGMIEVKTLLSELATGAQINLTKDLETPLKQLVLNLLSAQTEGSLASGKGGNNSLTNPVNNNMIVNSELIKSTPMAQVNSTGASILAGSDSLVLEGVKLAEMQNVSEPMEVFNQPVFKNMIESDKSEVLSQSANVKNDDKGLENLKGILPLVGSEINEQEKVKVFDLLQSRLGHSLEEVKALLEQFGVKEEALILKNELTLNLKNVAVSQLITNQPDTVKALINQLVSDINRHALSEEKLNELVEILKSDEPDEDKLIQIVKHLDSEGKLGVNTRVEANLVKELSNFSKPLYDQVIYMPIHVPIGKDQQQVELYYRKKKKAQEDSDQFQILIALNTKHFDEVRCVVDKNKNNIDLNFSFIDEASVKAFEGLKNELETALERFDQFKFKLSFRLRSESHPIQELLSDESTQFGFDMKV